LDAIRQVRITEQPYYCWRKHYGGLGTDQLKELRRIQKENEPLRKAVSALKLDKLILAEAAQGNYKAPLAAVPLSITWVVGSGFRNGVLVVSWDSIEPHRRGCQEGELTKSA
jgi:hypothetical protein